MAAKKLKQKLCPNDLHQVYNELLPAKNKWYNLGLALGLDSSRLDGVKDEKNIDNRLREMLKICLDTIISLTWSDLCECLEEPSVSLNVLAGNIKKKIRTKRKRSHHYSNGGSVASDDSDAHEDDTLENGAPATSSSVTCRTKRRDDRTAYYKVIEWDNNLRAIDAAFIKLQDDTIKSLTDKYKTPEKLVDSLLYCGHETAVVNHGKVLLTSYFDDLKKDESIKDFLARIHKCMSFLDYHLLGIIIKEYGDKKDEENLTKYIDHFKDFLATWQVKSLVVNESTEDQTKLKFKLDTNSLRCYIEIKGAIANLFKVHVGMVFLVEIKPGCVELIFALPMTAVERLLSLTLSQIAEVAEWTPTVLNVTVVDGRLKDNIIYEPISEMMLKACRSETPPNVDLVRNYLEQNGCDVNIREDDEFKWSSLMWALENYYFEIAKLLLKYKPQVCIQDKEGWSPLVLASRAGDLEIVQGIVALGAEIDRPTNKGWTPLMWAAVRGHAEVARFLLEKGASVDFLAKNGWTPVMQASQEGHVNVVNVFLDHKANVNHLSSPITWCALMAAAKNKHSDVVDTLLKSGAQVDIPIDDGITTLQVVSYYPRNSGIIDTLIYHGANVDHVNKDGMTALMLASSEGHLDAVQALQRHGADLNKEHPESGCTALFFAAKAGNIDVFKELLCRGATSSAKVENVARMCGHEELLSDIRGYKVSEAKTCIMEEIEQTRKSLTLLNALLRNFNEMIETSCQSNERAPAA